MNRTTISTIAVIAVAATATPVAAHAATSAPTPDPSTSPAQLSNEDSSGTSGASPFIQAESQQAADRILEGIEAGTVSAAAKRYGPCTLHPSKTRKRKGKVRIKPHTQCTVNVTSIRHSTDLRYKSFVWWKLKGTKRSVNYGQTQLQQKNAEFQCVSNEKTGWGNTTSGKMVYNGKTYYARVYAKRTSLACGG